MDIVEREHRHHTVKHTQSEPDTRMQDTFVIIVAIIINIST
jgi:hypothetical protein